MTSNRYKVADEEELEAESRVITEVNGREIAVFAVDGEYHAVMNYCVHQGGPLCEGPLASDTELGKDGWEWHHTADDQIIVCPWHSWRFDITTGENVDDARYRVPTFDVEAEDGVIYVCF